MRLDVACSNIVDCEHKTAPIDEAGEYFAVGTPAMRDDRINYAEARRISRETFEAWTRRLSPRAGDLLFAREAPVGPVVRLPDVANVAPGQRTVLLRPDPNVVHSAFLYYALTAPAARAGLIVKAEGSTVHHLNVPDIRSFEVWVPSLPAQQAIVEVLGAHDDKIAANTALAATADLYASTVLLGSLGAGRVRLASIAHITMGSSPKGDTLNELGQGVPFYQGVRDFGFRSPTRRVFTTAPVRSANAGDILVSVRAPVGDVNVADEPVCIGRGIAAVRSTTGTQATLLHQLKAERDAWEPFEAEGTVFGSINRDQLHRIQVRAVAPERVEFVEEELAAIESSIAAALAENRTLAATRDALLPQLMSGKLRVGDIGRTASGVEA